MFNTMFDNIGGKIKSLAKILCWIGIISSIFISILMFIEAGEGSYRTEDLYIKLGCIFLILGPLSSWISSFYIYGFGELIERTTEVAINTRNLRNSNIKTEDTPLNNNTISSSHSNHKWRCEKCGILIDKIPCPNCGYEETTERQKILDDLLKDGLITVEEYNQKMQE